MNAGEGNAAGGPREPDAPREPESAAEESSPERTRRARWLAARVIIVQIITLVALWVLQSTFGSA